MADKGGSREPKQEAESDDVLDKGEEMICEHTEGAQHHGQHAGVKGRMFMSKACLAQSYLRLVAS